MASRVDLDDAVSRLLLGLLPVVRLLEILDDSTIGTPVRRHWTGLLEFALRS
jgi:hypothetical protein